ncbi:MAG TPA: hypothetical protein VGD74_09615 [Vulgatibacter sp.]
MIRAQDEMPAPEQTQRGDIEIAPHALRSGVAQEILDAGPVDEPVAIPQPQPTTAERPGALGDPRLRHRARSWLSGPDERAEPRGAAPARAAVAKARAASDDLIDRIWVWGRRTREDLRDSLRHRDRWFAWKAGIVACWVLLSLICLGVAASGGERQPARNDLGAYVVMRPSSLSWALLVENRSGLPWTEVEIEVEGFTYRQSRVLPEERLVLGPSQFGAEAAAQLARGTPAQARIRTKEGSVERTFPP